MDYNAICEQICTVLLAALDDAWSAYPNIESTFSVPAVFVMDPTRWEPSRDFSDNTRLRIPIRYAVSGASIHDSRMSMMEALVIGQRALENSGNLSDLVEALAVAGVESFGNFRTSDGLVYYGAEQQLEFMVIL